MAGVSLARFLNVVSDRAEADRHPTESYELFRSRASAADFHRREVAESVRPEIWWHEVTGPALVVGSTQSRDSIDTAACAEAGIEVVRRRSGGGAVLLIPGEVIWIDVILPAGATGWGDDVHAPMVWLGKCLADVVAGSLESLGRDAEVVAHEGKMVTTRWSSLLCFDGLGAGEVLLDGKKLIGISQRRTRISARLQCCWYSSYDPNSVVSLLVIDHRPPLNDLRPVATLARSVAAAIPELLLTRLNE